MSVVPQKQKKRAVKKDKRGIEREKRVRCPDEISKRDKEKYAAGNAAYLHHTVLDYVVVTKQFLYDSTLYYMEQRLLQCI